MSHTLLRTRTDEHANRELRGSVGCACQSVRILVIKDEKLWAVGERRTLAIRARNKPRTRYFQRSSSVCMTIKAKFVFGSISPVISSTRSICLLMRSLTRSMRPSAGHLCFIVNTVENFTMNNPLRRFPLDLHTQAAPGQISPPPMHASGLASHGFPGARHYGQGLPLAGCRRYPWRADSMCYRGIISCIYNCFRSWFHRFSVGLENDGG